jgi:prefoldin subunit 5
MEKEQFEQLAKLLTGTNKHLEQISSRLDGIDKTLDKLRTETKKRRKSYLDI